MQRSRHLDGLRTLAIAWVVLYHYAWFWAPAGKGASLLPYGDALSDIPLAQYGYLGVCLFFVISGIVITLSLDRAPSPGAFAWARLVRLWPTLVLCGTLTFIATSILGPPALQRSWVEAMASLTFLPPPYIAKLGASSDWHWLDGAYWSLWTEVRFYAITGTLFFLVRPHFLAAWSLFAALSATVHIIGLMGLAQADALSRLLFAEYQPFFSAGIALAYITKGTDQSRAALLFAASWLLALSYTSSPANLTLIAATSAAFALPTIVALRPNWIPFLAWRPVSAIGQASYSYYLLHQNFGLALLLALPFTGSASICAMVAIQVTLIAASRLILHSYERPILQRLRTAKPTPEPRQIPNLLAPPTSL